MSKRVIPLAETQVRNARPRDKAYKLFDGGGLYLEVFPSGTKSWKFKFQAQSGREGKLTFGPYPDVFGRDDAPNEGNIQWKVGQMVRELTHFSRGGI